MNQADFTGARVSAQFRAPIDPGLTAQLHSHGARSELLRETVGILLNLRLAVSGEEESRPVSVPTIQRAGSDTRLGALSLTDEEYWCSNEGITSEHRFHDRLYCLVRLINAAYAQNDVDAMCDAIRRLLWVADHVVSEPLQSVYDTGLVLGLLNIGCAAVDRYVIEDGYRLAARCFSVLESKRSRRATLGLPSRPDSECWYRLYSLLAELKWKGSAGDLNRLVTPKALVNAFDRVEQRCLHYCERTPSNDLTRDQRLRESLGWCRLELIKMAIMYVPELVEPTLGRFNAIHGTSFTAEPGYFLNTPTGDRHSPWYWDLELYKWCVAGPATLDEALMCHQWRLDSLRAQQRERSTALEAYLIAAESELKSLLERGPRQQVA